MRYTKEQQKANREKWIAALRSGEYEQTEGRLRDSYSFCCLGVACDLAAQEGIGYWSGDNGSDMFFHTESSECDSSLPREVRHWLGLRTGEGAHDIVLVEDNRKIHSLIDANDNRGWNFNRIADLIESNPTGLLEG